MKTYLILLFFTHSLMGMYHPVQFEDVNEQLRVDYERFIKSLHDEHIRTYMYKFYGAPNTQIFRNYFRAYALRAVNNHHCKPADHSFEDVARFSLSYSLSREEADPVLQLMVKKTGAPVRELERIKDMYYSRFRLELAQRSMEMMKALES